MSDHADIVRELIEEWVEIAYGEGLGRPDGKEVALAALDALVAERDELQVKLDCISGSALVEAKEAAEAELANVKDIRASLAKALVAMEAEVARLREALREIAIDARGYDRARVAEVARLREALREIAIDAGLLGGLIQWAESPQGGLVGSIRKRARAALGEDAS